MVGRYYVPERADGLMRLCMTTAAMETGQKSEAATMRTTDLGRGVAASAMASEPAAIVA